MPAVSARPLSSSNGSSLARSFDRSNRARIHVSLAELCERSCVCTGLRISKRTGCVKGVGDSGNEREETGIAGSRASGRPGKPREHTDCEGSKASLIIPCQLALVFWGRPEFASRFRHVLRSKNGPCLCEWRMGVKAGTSADGSFGVLTYCVTQSKTRNPIGMVDPLSNIGLMSDTEVMVGTTPGSYQGFAARLSGVSLCSMLRWWSRGKWSRGKGRLREPRGDSAIEPRNADWGPLSMKPAETVSRIEPIGSACVVLQHPFQFRGSPL